MLDSLRKGAGSWIAKIFLGLLVLSFAAWGIGDIFRVRPDTAVATVGDIAISQEQFTRAFNRELTRLQRQLGAVDSAQARQLGLDRQTLNNLITQALYDQAADDLGLTVGIETIREEIAGNRVFFDELGRFDAFRFEQALRQSGLTEETYVAQRRNQLAREQLFGAVTSGAQAPRRLVETMYRHQQQRRGVEVVRLPHVEFPAPAVADQASLEAYHQQHATRYTAPELRSLTYISLQPADLAQEIVVDPAEARAQYEARRAEFAVPEVREVEQILVQDEALAQRIAGRLSEGGEFYAVAEEMAELGREDVKLGEIRRGDLPAEVEDTVFGLAQGLPSEPVQSPFGWHVFRVTAITPGRQRGFDEVREEIEADLRLERATDALYDLSNRIEDALAGGAPLDEIAASFGLKLERVTAASAAGENVDGEPVEAVPEIAGFLQTAFETQPGEQPVLHESESGIFYLLRVDEVTPANLRPLDKVRDRVLADWQADAQRKAAEAKAKALAERARAGDELAAVAGRNGLQSRTSEPLTRARIGTEMGLDRRTVEAVFELALGEVTVGADPAGDAAVVVKLREIQETDPSSEPEAVDELAERLGASVAGDLIEQFTRALEQSHDVEVNQRVVESIFAQPGV